MVTPALSYPSGLCQAQPFANQHLKLFWKGLLNLVLTPSQFCPTSCIPTTEQCRFALAWCDLIFTSLAPLPTIIS